jgi:tetratricopeptide (TPR) repeat protein
MKRYKLFTFTKFISKILIAALIIYAPNLTFAQRYFQPSSTQYQSQFAPLDLNLMHKILKDKEAEFDQNQNYLYELEKWVIDLKAQTNDNGLIAGLDYYLKKLKSYESADLAMYRSELKQIEVGVLEEISKYNKKIEEAPTYLWNEGNDYFDKKKYALAISDYSELIKLQPNFAYSYFRRGLSYYYIGNSSLALTDLNKFIEFVNDEPAAFEKRGWIYYYQKNYMKSLLDFNKQIELLPNYAIAYYNRGSAKSELNDNIGAIADYTKAIELQSDFSMAYNNRGWEKFKLKKYQEALKDLDKSIELDPENFVAFDSRQETKFNLNDFKGCIEDCNFALALNPKHSNSYFYRGRAFYKQGNKLKACEDWSKAGENGLSEAYDYITKYCNN